MGALAADSKVGMVAGMTIWSKTAVLVARTGRLRRPVGLAA